MKKLLIGIGAIVVLVIVAALVVPFVIPTETYKSQILAQIQEATGREARIDGDFSFTLLPRVKFVAGDVSLANAPGGKAKNMVSLSEMNVRVALFPLLGGALEIDSFVLEKPVINLEVDNAGKPNWELAGAAGKDTQPKEAAPKSGSGGAGLSGLKLGDVRLVDGRVSYSDARTGVTHQVDDIDVSLALPSLDSPMKIDGSLIWNKEKITLVLGVANPNGFLNGRNTGIETKISASPVTLSFKGSASNAATLKANGAVDLDVPSIRKLAAWAGAKLDAPGNGYGPLKITGEVDVDGAKYAFRKASLSVDDIKGTGEIAFDASRATPAITGQLRLGSLDLNPYLPPEGKKPGSAPARPAAGGGKDASPASSGWSEEPIDLSGLKSVDANLDLAVDGILVRKIKIGPSSLKTTLKNGVLVADLTKMALYDGTGRAKLTADGSGKTPRIALTFDLANFQSQPFLKDAADFDRLEGAANADLSISAEGRSQRDMVSSLVGAGMVQFRDGAISGINLAAMLRNVKSAFLDPGAKVAQKTDFAELGGTYTISRGLLTNNDLSLKSPLLRVAGKGTVHLPQRTVNYRVEPKVVASSKGQGGDSKASGIMVPVIVTGPWDNLSYRPDLAGVLENVAKDPKKALDSLKNLVPGKGATDPGKSDPVDRLKGLFGR